MMRCRKIAKKGGRQICRLLLLGVVLGGEVLSAAGCSMPTFGEEEAENVLVIIENPDEEESVYTLTEAVLTDLEKTVSIRFNYTQAQTENVYFPVSGKRVAEVYVDLGDRVEEGQLLAVLEGTDHEDAIRELEYQIARCKIQYSYLDDNEAYAKSARWWRYVYQSSQTEEEEERLANDLESIEETYRYKREDYQETIEMAEIRIETYRKEMEEGYIYAGMSGVVYRLGGDLATILSDVSKPAFTIIDDSHCLFEASDMEYAEYFAEGETYELVSGRGDSAVVYRVRPWSRDTWDDKIYLDLVEDGDTESIGVGTYAYLTLVLEKRENVVAVTNNVIHTADGKSYVYVLDENGLPEVRWVETGLCSDKMTEIVSGLEEGEAVIRK